MPEESDWHGTMTSVAAAGNGYLSEGLYRGLASQPFIDNKLAMKWDGEWHITYEVFRDLGLAFAVVLVLIYILAVGWFPSFKTPVAIMVAIPVSLDTAQNPTKGYDFVC